VDTKHSKTGPKEVFLHLLATILLYVSAGSVIALLFQYINYFFPDPLEVGRYVYESSRSGMRFSISTLIVVFPVYVWVSWYLQRLFKKDEAVREMRSRKWLLYLTLFVAALIIIGDLVSLIYSFLGGDITIRFVLKVLAVLMVALWVFWYYLLDLRNYYGWWRSLGVKKVIVLVSIAVLGGFFVVGSPQEERLRRFDERRVNDLQSIQWQIINYWQAKAELPESLDVLRDDIKGYVSPIDPATGDSYEYNVLDGLSFELCAMFDIANYDPSGFTETLSVKEPFGILPMESWDHDAGRYCFERTIDPDLYQVREGLR
jgi:hypothetical protein